ncbi:hypothetical protein FJT64_015719 [Amphibalanus amphitrite]|uniref:Uncharacterized protein n=1 Tax=Amphibalanus amphitrite TaxID=1232801 RepID=A0A6A4XCJ9_AMPAM|nr:hypothetical protein FJT64_015719 [Amphibalanus amphitrite]
MGAHEDGVHDGTIARRVDALEASAADLAESSDRDQLLVDVTDLRHRLTDLHGQARPAQLTAAGRRHRKPMGWLALSNCTALSADQ